MTEWDYEGSDQDFGYEVSGATGEEFEHMDGCNWVYDNCTCGMAEKLHTLMNDESDVNEYEDWQMRRSELIARLNSLRHEIETTGIKSNSYNLETIETCLYYFIDEEDADPHARIE